MSRTFVLVHGAGGGGWVFRDARRELQRAGHEVFAPSLTGCGDKEHLNSRLVSFSTHVDDIANLLYYEDLTDVVLVGHSYGGNVITVVADRCRDRIRQLVYLDANIPRANEPIIALMPPEFRLSMLDATTSNDGWRIRPFGLERYGEPLPEPIKSWSDERRVEFSFLISLEPVVFDQKRVAAVPRSFIHATRKPNGDIWAVFANQARAEGWPMREIDAGHTVPLSHPGELARCLVELSDELDGS
jgi:pimeloyl-ACP methyl ester carboxylesterase